MSQSDKTNYEEVDVEIEGNVEDFIKELNPDAILQAKIEANKEIGKLEARLSADEEPAKANIDTKKSLKSVSLSVRKSLNEMLDERKSAQKIQTETDLDDDMVFGSYMSSGRSEFGSDPGRYSVKFDSEKDVDMQYEDEYGYAPYGRYYEEITKQRLKDVAMELGRIKLSWPEEIISEDRRSELPPSYSTNNDKEKMLLLYAENFRRQFHYALHDRKPLMLAAENECGIQKMVCTTIRPTKLLYPELSDWYTCSEFIAGHIEYESLDKPTLLPDRIASPTTVLESHRGHCFEMSIVLCSYLIGSFYKAYVACGYAVREICLNDLTRDENPFSAKKEEVVEEQEEDSDPKYVIKKEREIKSRYQQDMENLRRKKEEAEEHERLEEERKLIEEMERPPPDEMFGTRIHCWVLILPGARDITEPFFIEPATGNRYEVSSENYLGLESIWDDTNYWVNMQECSEGCKTLKFDLMDVSCWEHLLPGEPWQSRKLAGADEESETLQEKHLDMPTSWVSRLDISHSKYTTRYAGGGKQVLYKKSKLEKYAPFETREGLVSRSITYQENDWEAPECVTEIFDSRVDKLVSCKQNLVTESMTQTFDRGRDDCLKVHSYFLASGSVEDKRVMEFYSESRVDGLSKLELDPLFLTQHFVGRRDLLYLRHIVFAPRVRIAGIAEGPKRTVQKLTEKFHRDPTKEANNDIATRTFAIADNEIQLKYHYEDHRITAQTRVFIKPSLADMADHLTFNPDLTHGYMVDPTASQPKLLDLFHLLEKMLVEEETALYHVREVEDEVAKILKLRDIESAVPKLQVSMFDMERNEESKEQMKARDQQLLLKCARDVETEVDYVMPYIARIGGTTYLNRARAMAVRDDCLHDFCNMMVNRASVMQTEFDRVSQILHQKHRWYEEQQDNMTHDEEEAYFDYTNRMTFLLHTLEMRLNRHRDLVPKRYRNLETRLRADPRLITYL